VFPPSIPPPLNSAVTHHPRLKLYSKGNRGWFAPPFRHPPLITTFFLGSCHPRKAFRNVRAVRSSDFPSPPFQLVTTISSTEALPSSPPPDANATLIPLLLSTIAGRFCIRRLENYHFPPSSPNGISARLRESRNCFPLFMKREDFVALGILEAKTSSRSPLAFFSPVWNVLFAPARSFGLCDCREPSAGPFSFSKGLPPSNLISLRLLISSPGVAGRGENGIPPRYVLSPSRLINCQCYPFFCLIHPSVFVLDGG